MFIRLSRFLPQSLAAGGLQPELKRTCQCFAWKEVSKSSRWRMPWNPARRQQ